MKNPTTTTTASDNWSTKNGENHHSLWTLWNPGSLYIHLSHTDKYLKNDCLEKDVQRFGIVIFSLLGFNNPIRKYCWSLPSQLSFIFDISDIYLCDERTNFNCKILRHFVSLNYIIFRTWTCPEFLVVIIRETW